MSKKKDKKKPQKKHVAASPASKPGTFLARVYVSLKPTVNDPEGITIGSALGSLGFGSSQVCVLDATSRSRSTWLTRKRRPPRWTRCAAASWPTR